MRISSSTPATVRPSSDAPGTPSRSRGAGPAGSAAAALGGAAPALDRQPELAHQRVGERRRLRPGEQDRHRSAPAISTRVPCGSGRVRRPSHDRTPSAPLGSTSRATTVSCETTNGRANSACALIGTRGTASTPGHTTGPPPENAYAVEPVGVAATTPSHPQRDSGRWSTSTTSSSIRSRAAFSTDASFSAQPCSTARPSWSTVTSSVMRSSTVKARSRSSSTVSSSASDSAAARKPTRPRLTPSSGTDASRASSAERRIDPSPPSTSTTSVPAAASRSNATTRTPVSPMSVASSARTRTSTPASCRRRTTRRAASAVDGRPVWATSSTERVTGAASHRPRGAARAATADPRGRRAGGRPRRAVARRRAAAGSTPRCRSDRAAGWRRRPPPRARARRRRRRPARTASARRAGSRTTPPLGSRSRPTSNCGFTIGSRSAPGPAQDTRAGSTRDSGMKDRSATTRSTGRPTCSGPSVRTFVRSSTVTLGSVCSDQASWP